MPDAKGHYRILSLDGGGSWALLQALALLSIYGDTITGHRLLSRFDLVAANSGGSIVAAALATDRTLPQILALVADATANYREKIFHPLPFYDELTRITGIGPKYSTKHKLPALEEIMNSGPKRVADIPLSKLPGELGIETHFLIPAFDYDLQRARFFRSDVTSRAATFAAPDTVTTLVQAVHASSTPPVQYFDEPAEFNCGRFWDGGVAGYNNPLLAAVLELLAKGVHRDNIRALSLGSGHVMLPRETTGPATDAVLIQGARDQGLRGDIIELAGSIVNDPLDSETFHAHLALTQKLPHDIGHPLETGPIVRLNPLIRPVRDSTGRWVPPCLNQPPNQERDLADFKELIRLNLDVIKQHDIDLIMKLGAAWLENRVRNQPIRFRANEDIGCEIGHDSFTAGKSAWLGF
jgi:uncharacterized protein